jgi:hypothetical protein
MMSLRASMRSMMIEAEPVPTEAIIERLLARADVDYIQAHYAKRGCYAARITRAG